MEEERRGGGDGRIRLPPAIRPASTPIKPQQDGEAFRRMHSKSAEPSYLEGNKVRWQDEQYVSTDASIPLDFLQDFNPKDPSKPLSQLTSSGRSVKVQNRGQMQAILERIAHKGSGKRLSSSQTFPSIAASESSIDDMLSRLSTQSGVPTREDAIALSHSLSKMEETIRENLNGQDAEQLAKTSASEADADRVMSLLEPKIYAVDVVMIELVRQVKANCLERGLLLERCRLHFLNMFSIAAVTMNECLARFRTEKEKSTQLAAQVAPLEDSYNLAVQKISALELELQTATELADARESDLEDLRRNMQRKPRNDDELQRGKREKALADKIEELQEISAILRSKVEVAENQIQAAERNNAMLHVQVQELQERIRRDAEKIDIANESMARYKIRYAWLQVLLFVRKSKNRSKLDAATQDGEGLDALVKTIDEGVFDENAQGEGKTKALVRAAAVGGAMSFQGFWNGIVKQAEGIDLNANPDLRMTKEKLSEVISTIYTEKVLADELDDKLRMPRENLPEFSYGYFLEMFGDPSLAEEALVNLVANVKLFDKQSARVRMFARFLQLGTTQLPLESLNVYLASLIRIQNGQAPLLPDADSISVDSEKALKVIQFVFAQAPFIVKSKIIIECEKRAVGRQIDLDSLLLFIVEKFKEEQGRTEERLKALYVAADSNADGDLDFNEFANMCKHTSGERSHREMLRMFAEMTLNRVVDANTFVRVARKYKLSSFGIGSLSKKVEKSIHEVFDLLVAEWKKVEDMILEYLVLLEGSAVGTRLEEDVAQLKRLLNERTDAEKARHPAVGLVTTANLLTGLDVLPQGDY
mmetsp:Transcript_34329/g.107623  ORF Transcript_34329/g.107623 Transcript_34329/m.107623 type:complete len:818 (-) Transcript_34329:283-2736(-)